MKGTDWRYRKVADLKTAALELLIDESGFRLPNNAFVFAMHQGWNFNFFLADSNVSDPPVLYYEEHAKSMVTVAESFSAFLTKELEYQINMEKPRG